MEIERLAALRSAARSVDPGGMIAPEHDKSQEWAASLVGSVTSRRCRFLDAGSEAPFFGAPICFGPTGIRRSPGVSSGGTTVCGGAYSLDVNAFAAGSLGGNPSPALRVPGSLVYCRFWGRDDFLWGGDVQLTDALEYGVRA